MLRVVVLGTQLDLSPVPKVAIRLDPRMLRVDVDKGAIR
ncbi:hypothetical protein LINGRAHAP2_LOCUS23286, partial [Linum grandiflorum]